MEGFHAAETTEVSVLALAEAEESAERTHGQRQFHIGNGYGSLVNWLVTTLEKRGVPFQFNTILKKVRWQKEHAEVVTNNEKLKGRAVVVTLPLGVLQTSGRAAGHVVFDPELPSKKLAIRALEMGNITKLTLTFREPFWPDKLAGFIHVHGAPFPTWWIDERGPVLTGWAGGPKADAFRGSTKTIEVAIAELGKILDVSGQRIQQLLLEAFWHDWRNDPYSRGAYSYVLAGNTEAARHLAQPVAGTLFFAGEAVAPAGEQGTVHGALASGMRAASELMECM